MSATLTVVKPPIAKPAVCVPVPVKEYLAVIKLPPLAQAPKLPRTVLNVPLVVL